jgi:hypothetical protein
VCPIPAFSAVGTRSTRRKWFPFIPPLTYDFLKILDPWNPFRVGCSQTFIIRDNNLTIEAGRRDLEAHIDRALEQAVERLAGRGFSEDREIHLMVSEIATHERRHWHYDRKGNAGGGRRVHPLDGHDEAGRGQHVKKRENGTTLREAAYPPVQ